MYMQAKDAYQLAASKGQIDALIDQIKAAAEQGLTSIQVPRLNDFQVRALIALGYSVFGSHEDNYGAIRSSDKPTKHRIDWNFPNEDLRSKVLAGLGAGT